MNFFEHQDLANRRTNRLVVLFILAVVAIIVGVYLAFSILAFFTQSRLSAQRVGFDWWNPVRFAWVCGGTLVVIFLGSITKLRQLSGGGATVAQMMGGTPVPPNTTNLGKRRLLNVVEEMALASGLPVPEVYVLENEPGINAFAAGFTPSDAVIGVTQGTLDTLNRDELQGVVAHEFSHILNGDMRLNLRLIGILNGILIIGLSGYWLLRIMSRTRIRGGRGGGGAAILGILVLGLLLLIVGYLGLFFGKLIQAGVCRQREYLADASSVQFTRNPSGIAGALKKIGGFLSGSQIEHQNSAQASHLFFGSALKRTFWGLLATHPPLPQRIKAIDPSFDGEFEELPGNYRVKEDSPVVRMAPTKMAPARKAPAPAKDRKAVRDEVVRTSAQEVVDRVGAPSPDHISYSQALLDSFPEEVNDAVREPFGAQAVVFCLLLDRREEIRSQQLTHLEKQADAAAFKETERLMTLIVELGPAARLPLIDLALPALRRLSLRQYNRFADNIQVLIEADKRVDLFEYTLQKMLLKHLRPVFAKPARPVARVHSIEVLADEIRVVLSALARVGHVEPDEVERAFRSAMGKLHLKQDRELCPADQCNLSQLNQALDRIVLAAPKVKEQVIQACAHCVAYDGQVTLPEAELLRAIGDTLDCPIPPFLSRT